MGTLAEKAGDLEVASDIVSIQLVSPASGDTLPRWEELPKFSVSIQLVSPASGDSKKKPISCT